MGLSSLPPALLLLGLALALSFAGLAFRAPAAALSVFAVMTFFDIDGVDMLTKLAGALLVGVWALLVFTRGSRVPLLVRDRPVLGASVLLLAGWFAISTVWAGDERLAIVDSTRLLQGVLLIVLVYTMVSRREHVRWVMSGFILGAFISSIFGLTSSPTGDGRITGGFDDPNELAAVIVPGGALAAFAFAAMRGSPWRWVCLALVPLFGIALLDTDSQGGLVALVAAAAAGIALGGPIRVHLATLVAAFGIAVLGFYALKPPSPGQFTEGRTSRLDLWNVALHVAHDHPLLGVGAGNFPVVEPAYTLNNIDLVRADLITSGYVAHNTYLNVLADYGSVGLVLLLAVAFGAMLVGLDAARRFARLGDRELNLLARGHIVAVVAMLTAYFFQSGQFEKQLWLMIGCSAALDAVARGMERRTERAPVPAPMRAAAVAASLRAGSLAT